VTFGGSLEGGVGGDERPDGLVGACSVLVSETHGAALRLATISARIASTAPSRPLGRPGSPAGLRGAGGADRVQRIGLAVPVPVLPTGPVDLHHPDPVLGEVPGQAGAVAAGALHADQGDVPELAEPSQHAGVPGRGRWELPRPEQAADGIEALAQFALDDLGGHGTTLTK
jgi:hypothetical protein